MMRALQNFDSNLKSFSWNGLASFRFADLRRISKPAFSFLICSSEKFCEILKEMIQISWGMMRSLVDWLIVHKPLPNLL